VTVRQISIDAFRELENKLTQEQIVFNCIKEEGPICDRDIAYETGIEKTSVCGRRNSLYKKKLIIVKGIDRDPTTGKKVTLWGVN